MATEVSTIQMKSDAKSCLITRDFLGVCSEIDSEELDLDLHVPFGWEKRLDLKSGKLYIQRSNPAKTPSNERTIQNQLPFKLQDLSTNPTLNLLEQQPSLDLKLISNSSPSSYTSVCTLDKVKSALDRAERSSPPSTSTPSSRKRWMSPSPSNSSSFSIKETEDEVEKVSSGLLVAAACPVCFLYVLISKNDPKCPKCNSTVQLPVMVTTKKPKIDLNMSM
ncbi:hypothetical protein vseg_001906 [Gypsophila vaccaria]